MRQAKWVARYTRPAQVAGVGCGHRSACPEGPSNLGADSLAPLFETLSHTGCPLYFFGSREDGFAHPSGRLAPRPIDLPAVRKCLLGASPKTTSRLPKENKGHLRQGQIAPIPGPNAQKGSRPNVFTTTEPATKHLGQPHLPTLFVNALKSAMRAACRVAILAFSVFSRIPRLLRT